MEIKWHDGIFKYWDTFKNVYLQVEEIKAYFSMFLDKIMLHTHIHLRKATFTIDSKLGNRRLKLLRHLSSLAFMFILKPSS